MYANRLSFQTSAGVDHQRQAINPTAYRCVLCSVVCRYTHDCNVMPAVPPWLRDRRSPSNAPRLMKESEERATDG